jgi:hypothetical protein
VESDELGTDNPVEVCGVVTEAKFVNPHVLLHVRETETGAAVESWTFSFTGPNGLFRRGIDRRVFQEALFPSGTRVLVQGLRRKLSSRTDAYPLPVEAYTISLADGRTLTDGSAWVNGPMPRPRMRCWT